MKRLLIAAGLMVVAIVVGLGILPSNKGNAVLAQVARAMGKVKTVHLKGFWINGYSGERAGFHVWIKQPAKYRMKIYWGNGVIFDEVDDGTKRTILSRRSGGCSATIQFSEGALYVPGIPVKHGGLNLFTREGMLEATKWGIVASRQTTLPDRRKARVIELADFDLDDSRVVMTIDDATDLLAKVETFHQGKVVGRIESTKYNIDLPDSMFRIKIPRNATVDDKLHVQKVVAVPLSPERQAQEAAISKKMADEGGERIIGGMLVTGSCSSPYHPSMRFEGLSTSATEIWYVKSRNAYYVFGKALVTDSKNQRFRHVVTDGWLVASYPRTELLGELVLRIDKPGGYKRFIKPDAHDSVTDYLSFAERIQNTGKEPLILMSEGAKITFHGEAKVYPQGKVYHNGEVVESIWDMRLENLKEYDLAKADFGHLPDSEVAAMKGEMRKHNSRVRLIVRHRQDVESALKRLPGDAEVVNRFDPGWQNRDNYFQSDPKVGMTIIYIASRDSIYVVGRGRMVARRSHWRTERIVENEEVPAPGPEYARYHKERREQAE